MFIDTIFAAIESARFAAGFVEPEYASGVIPGQGPFEAGHIVLAQRQAWVLLGRAAGDVDQFIVWGEFRIDECALFFGKKNA